MSDTTITIPGATAPQRSLMYRNASPTAQGVASLGGSARSGNLPAADVTSFPETAAGVYNAFPGLDLLGDRRRPILVYRNGAGHLTTDGVIKQRLSQDGGQTWGGATTIVANPGGSIDLRDSEISWCPLLGKHALSYFHWSGAIPDGAGSKTVYVQFSADDGTTWGSAISIPAPYSGSTGLTLYAGCSSKVVELPDGTLLLAVYGQQAGDSQTGLLESAGLLKSTDGGTTWQWVNWIARDIPNARAFSEVGIVRKPSGRLIAFVRCDAVTGTNPADAGVWTCHSDDNGATWSAPAQCTVNNGGLGFGPGRPAPVLLPSGGIFLQFRGTVSGGEKCGIGTSWDDGATFATATLSNLIYVYGSCCLYNGNYVMGAVANEQAGGAEISFVTYFDGVAASPSGKLLGTIGTAGSVALGSPLALSGASGVYGSTGLSVTVPTAGTYEIAADLHWDIEAGNTSDELYLSVQLYNGTGYEANSARRIAYTFREVDSASVPTLKVGTTRVAWIVTTAAGQSYRIDIARSFGVTPLDTHLNAASSGQTVMQYRRIGS